jgi:hypothetical protein
VSVQGRPVSSCVVKSTQMSIVGVIGPRGRTPGRVLLGGLVLGEFVVEPLGLGPLGDLLRDR